jgi:plastocyanin
LPAEAAPIDRRVRFLPARPVALLLVLALLGACSGGDDSGPRERTIRVDFSHDEFGSYFLEYYPRKVTLRPGDTAVFKQAWTGEPHSVTMGTLVDNLVELVDPYIERMKGGEPLPEEEPPEVEEAGRPLPFMFGESFEEVNQLAAQPCYIETGDIPADVQEPCEEQTLPAFKGTETYYNSGFIPYEGSGGNEFRVPLSEDIDEGTYYFYCNYHGSLMSGAITVVGEGESIPSQEEVNRQAREEIEVAAQPLRDELEKAKNGELEIPEEEAGFLRRSGHLKPGTNFFRGNLSGLYAESSFVGGINEFIPKEIEARAGEKVTWINLGQHTISFDVPRYFPIISVEDDGTVVYNPRISPAAGGAPDPPEPNFEAENPEPVVIDAGTWDGEGFFSSGLILADPFVEYSITFSKPGTYKYACLIHPPMTGTVTVR